MEILIARPWWQELLWRIDDAVRGSLGLPPRFRLM